MSAVASEHPLVDGEAEALGENPQQARVLLGGRWFDIQYPEDVPSLSARVYAALGGNDDPPIMLPVLWGWGTGARAGMLTLRAVEGVVDNDVIDGEARH
jgi:hypothetical protein